MWKLSRICPKSMRRETRSRERLTQGRLLQPVHRRPDARGRFGPLVEALAAGRALHSARYAPTTDERNEKLLAELASLDGQTDRRATFYCAFAVAHAGQLVWTVQTELQGQIAASPRGDFGFGYDPVFVVSDHGKRWRKCRRRKRTRSAREGRRCASYGSFLQSQLNFPIKSRLWWYCASCHVLRSLYVRIDSDGVVAARSSGCPTRER